MKIPGIWGLAAMLLLATPAGAGDIYKYRGADGEILFTDQPRTRVSSDYTLLSVRKEWTYQPRSVSAFQRNRYDPLIRQAAHDFKVEPALVKAVIDAESRFNRYAVSHAGAQGLMQLMPGTARQLGVTDPFDPRANIRGGTRFLALLKTRFTTINEILAAYNAGGASVRRYGGIPPYPETRAYVKKVKALRVHYRLEMEGTNLASR